MAVSAIALAIYLQAGWQMVSEGMPDLTRAEILRGYLMAEEVSPEEYTRVFHLNRRWVGKPR